MTSHPQTTNDLTTAIAQILEAHQVDLSDRYFQALRETLFSNRAQVRPNALKKIASQETGALLDFFRQGAPPDPERGTQLCQSGLGEQALLRLGQAGRQFLLAHVNSDQIAPVLEAFDSYHNALVQGFIQRLEKNIFEEQERTRRSALKVANRED